VNISALQSQLFARYVKTEIEFVAKLPRRFYSARETDPESYLEPYAFAATNVVLATAVVITVAVAAGSTLPRAEIGAFAIAFFIGQVLTGAIVIALSRLAAAVIGETVKTAELWTALAYSTAFYPISAIPFGAGLNAVATGGRGAMASQIVSASVQLVTLIYLIAAAARANELHGRRFTAYGVVTGAFAAILLLFLLLLVAIILPQPQPSAAPSAMAKFNDDLRDQPTFVVSDPTGATKWSSRLTNIRPGDLVTFAWAIHNTGTITAENVRVQLGLAYAATDISAAGDVISSNAPAAYGSARITLLGGYANVRLKYLQAHLITKQGSTPIDGSAAETGGIILGDVPPGWDAVRGVTVEYRVTGDYVARGSGLTIQ